MLVPGFADKGGNVGVTELASRVDRMGTEVTRLAMQAMMCRYRRVRVGRLKVVKGQLNKRDEPVPQV